ncbi:MAG TPA: TIGR00153 family protein [bacterium]|jgi:hypothetical protein
MAPNIFQIFAKSPFEPLTEHLKKCVETAEKVPVIIDALKKGDSTSTKNVAKEIMALEHDSDELKNEIRNHLPKTVFLPVDRRDLLRLLSSQDEIADRVEDLAVAITIMENLSVPESIVEELDRVVGLVMDCVHEAMAIGNEMDELLEAGFGGAEADRVQKMIHNIGELEWRADKRQYKLSQALVLAADNLKPVEIVMWVEIIKNLGRIANAAERYSKELRRTLVK